MIESAKQPRYCSEDKTQIECDVLLTIDGAEADWTPYVCSESDVEAPHSVELIKRCMSGELGEIQPFKAPVITKEEVEGARRLEYTELVDPLVAEVQRKQVLGIDTTQLVDQVRVITEQIKSRNPYPDE